MPKLSAKKIAITGSIGSGKTSVAKIIAKTYPSLSADQIVADLYKKPSFASLVNKQILGVDSDVVDKKLLAKTIFNNSDLKNKLEALIHPLVRVEIIKWLANNQGLIFVEVPLLYEASFEQLFDKVIVVVANKEEIIKRLAKNRGYTRVESLARLNQQLSVDKKIKKADYVIYNDGSYKDLKIKVSKLLKELEEGD